MVIGEDKANGTAVIDALKKDVPGMVPIEPDGGKVARANAASPLLEAGNVFVPTALQAPWISGWREEMATFPMGRNDDAVDATTQALNYMHGHKPADFTRSGAASRRA